MIADLLERAQGGNRQALGRLLSIVERGGSHAIALDELLTATSGPPAQPLVGTNNTGSGGLKETTSRRGQSFDVAIIGVTGAPGTGKSTLVGQLVALLCDVGTRPGVLAVDPSSPLTGGAILGDRVRMQAEATRGAFIRSMATRGHAGGLALAVPGALRLFASCGFAPLIVETVGVGQVEVDVAGTADTTVVVVAPGMGDAVQANKAGLLEMADVLVVNKADRPGATDARRDLELMLDLGHITGVSSAWRPEIVMTTATSGEGTDAVLRAIDAHRSHLQDCGLLDERREQRIRAEVAKRVTRQLDAAARTLLDSDPLELSEACQGRRTPASAAAAISERLLLASEAPG